MRVVFLLFGSQVNNFGGFRTGDLEHVTHYIQIFPADKNLDSTKFQGFKRVINSKAVFAGILTDLVKVSTYYRGNKRILGDKTKLGNYAIIDLYGTNQFLLLNEFDIC